MRRVVAGLLFVATLVAITASMRMNWTFWSAQGVNAETSHVLGAVSIMVDLFKAPLPVVIAWAWAGRMRVGAAIATAFFCGFLLFSLMSAIGFASWMRGATTENRAAASLRYTAAKVELGEADQGITQLSTTRPATVIGASIERAKQDRRWANSAGCKSARTESSRTFCAGLGDLLIELAASQARDKLQRRRTELRGEIDGLIGSGARLESDLQASILSRIFGVQLDRMQNALVVLVAVIVELSAGFGLFLASLPLRDAALENGGRRAGRSKKSDFAKRFAAANTFSTPTRLVRNPNGQLMIE